MADRPALTPRPESEEIGRLAKVLYEAFERLDPIEGVDWDELPLPSQEVWRIGVKAMFDFEWSAIESLCRHYRAATMI